MKCVNDLIEVWANGELEKGRFTDVNGQQQSYWYIILFQKDMADVIKVGANYANISHGLSKLYI